MLDVIPEWLSQEVRQGKQNSGVNIPGMRPGFSHVGSLMEREDISALLLNRLTFGEDPYLDQLIEQAILLDVVPSGLVEYPFPTPPDDDIYGPINLGVCEETGAPAGIYPDEVHFLVCAASGKGKTTLFRNLIRQHIDAGESVLSFDFENEYRETLNEGRMTFLGLDELKWNPLEVPPGMKPSRYRQMFCAVFSDVLGLLIASKSKLNNAIKRLYKVYGVDEGSGTYPSMYDLADLLAMWMGKTKSNTRDYTYLEVCYNRVQGFIDAFEDIVNCSSGMPLHILTQGNLTLELHGADFEYQSLLVNLMIVWLCCHRIENGLRNRSEHGLAVFLDEAQRIYDVQLERRVYQGLPTISSITATVRKYGIKLFVAAQQPSLLASSIAANSFTKMQMALGHGRDIMDMGSAMFLIPEQIYFTRRLETGQAVVKFNGRWTEPFVIRILYEE